MPLDDNFSQAYAEHTRGGYDCLDRIVLNGYVPWLQSGGGFRTWWRTVFGRDDNLDNTHLMRWAGRFARRVRAAAEANHIPLLVKQPDDRIHKSVQQLRPADPNFRGLFAISVHRAPNSVWESNRYPSGDFHLKRKQPWVNHYAFHIIDPDWGHITIKVCPHPPFHVQVTLNGHEYVACQAAREGIDFAKEGNCFTDSSNLAGLQRCADSLRDQSAIGRLEQACERWLYSACLCYLMPVAEQQSSGLRYQGRSGLAGGSRGSHRAQRAERVSVRKEFPRCGIAHLPSIASGLEAMLVRLMNVLRAVDSCWITDDVFSQLAERSQVGSSMVAGIDLNRRRMRAVIEGVLLLSCGAEGFRSEHLAARVSEILGKPYTSRQASYDLKKLRGKGWVERIGGSRRYRSPVASLRAMAASVLLREKVLLPLLSENHRVIPRRPLNRLEKLTRHYLILQHDLQQLLPLLGIAA